MKKLILLFSLFILSNIYLRAQMPQPLGHGVRTTGQIYCFAYDSINNRLYAGGYFENIGGVETPNIAWFDGTNWHAMDSGLTGIVTCMKMLNGKLYVGGYFSKAGNASVSNIASWDGTSWSAVGNTVVTTYSVMSLEVYKNELYLSAFLSMGIGATGIAKWDGTNWSVIANSNTTNATINLYSTNDTLFIYGKFQSLNGNAYSNMAAFDSVNFYDYSVATEVFSVIYFHNILYASASGYYYHYSNNAWVQDAQDAAGFLFTYNDSLYATFYNGGTSVDTIEIWNYNNGIKVKKCGSTYFSSTQYQVTISAAIEANQKVYLGGLFFNFDGKQIVTSVSYNGTSWNQFAGVAVAYYDSWLSAGISTMVRDSVTGDIYAGGNFLFAGDSLAFNVARWDGTQWHPVGEGFSSRVNKLIFYQDTLYACGQFKRTGSTVVNAISKWSGTSWVTVGSGSSGSLYDMEVLNNVLYVAGNFTTFNGLNANYVVKYNGTNWSIVGSNDLDEIVFRLATYNNQLIAGTYYSSFNFSSNVIQLNGSVWTALSSCPGNSLGDLREFNGKLYATTDDVYELNGSTWTSTGLASLGSSFGGGTFNVINGKLVTTISNDGMYMLDTTWKPFQYFIQAYAVIKLNNTDYVIGGFFPYYFNGFKDVYLYNAGLLQLKKPDVLIGTDHDSICSHQYVFFDAPTSTFPTTYQWQFPGGIPATSNLQSPIVKYNVPGQYDVFLKSTNYYGSDSVLAVAKIQVYSCTAGIDEQVVQDALVIYPNPSSDVVHVFYESQIESIQIINSLGKSVFTNSLIFSNQVDLNISDYSKGLYIVKVKSGDKIFTQKFVRN